MTAALARRGPDADGLAVWPGAILGHRRLAILDLSDAGRQPMLSDDGSVGVVFNGCIYNFLDLREELKGSGRKFRSNCDTETLLHGYCAWGIDELTRRLRGMFAFAIWDHPRRTLFLVRDRLGVKPLAYAADEEQIGFASTVGALHGAGFGRGVDPQAILEFLEFGYVTDDRAVYSGIAKLPPATILEWRDGRMTQRRYWSLPAPEQGHSPAISFEEAIEETERLLIESVRLRLISDVPAGALLSGGIDSALICWAMRQLNTDLKAFTVRAPNDPSDESVAAAQTARTLGVPHEIVDMPACEFSLAQTTEAYSEPFGCSSAQAMLWVSRAVKRNATVLLTGDGADDVFLGYPFFHNAWIEERIAQHMPAAAASLTRAAAALLPNFGPARRLKNVVNFVTGGLGERRRASDGLQYYETQALLGEKLAARELSQRQIPASLEAGRRLLSDVLAYHRKVHFTGEFMTKVDGATMHYALEARAPFLDQKLWEFAAALSPTLHFRGGRLKAVLREIARRRIGPEVAFRRKQGFTVPVDRWLAGQWSGMLDRLRGGTLLERQGWIRGGALNAPLDEAMQRGRIPEQLWRLLVLEHWLEKDANTSSALRVSAGAGA